jgi:hypothetical protein
MAKTKRGADKDLFGRLRSSGLRKKVARQMSDATGGGRGRKKPSKAVRGVLDDLKSLTADIEDRITGGPGKRKATAKKAAATRKRNAAKRSAAAKKGARTRAKARS